MDERFARLRTLTFVVIGLGALLLGLPLLCIRPGAPASTYSSYLEAERAGAVGHGWIPPWVPRSATAIREVHDIASSRQWLRFELPLDDAKTMVAAMQPLPLSEARALSGTRPGSVGWWPPELNPSFSAEPRPAGELTFHRAADPGGGSYCLAVEWTMPAAYAWTC